MPAFHLQLLYLRERTQSDRAAFQMILLKVFDRALSGGHFLLTDRTQIRDFMFSAEMSPKHLGRLAPVLATAALERVDALKVIC